jgi:hypothetical protein
MPDEIITTNPPNITGTKNASVQRLADRFGKDDPEALRRRGIDPDTFERKAVTWKGLLEEFGKPVGPRLYNAIAVAAFGGVPSNRADLSIMTLQDDYIMPRGRDESDEVFTARLEKHRARRAKVEQLIADAEGGNG